MIGKLETDLDRKRQDVAYFESGAAYAEEANKRADKAAGESQSAPKSWNGNVTFDEAVRMGRDGWPEGRDRVTQLTGNLVASIAGRICREEWVTDCEGSYVDLGLFVAREPEYWVRPEEVYSETGSARRHVRILYNGTVSAGVDPDVIEARGAAIAALADLLELAGNAVTVDLVFTVDDGQIEERKRGKTQFIALKPATERADLGKLMFWLAHPSALRRLGFAYWEGYNTADRDAWGFWSHRGYGHLTTGPFVDEHEPKPDVYIGQGYIGTPEGRGRWTDIDATRRWLESTLAELGVRLTPA
jgi:hypothetical protein